MTMSGFLRERAQAYADHIVATLFLVGGSALTGWLINHYGSFLGLDPRVALVLAWVIALLVAVALSLLLKPKQKPNQSKTERARATQHNLPQSGIVNAPHFEFNPQFNPTIQVNPAINQSHAQSQASHSASSTQPDIEFVNPVIIDSWIDDEHGLTEDEYEDSFKLKVVLGRFYYKPDRGVPPRIFVKAHISIADSTGFPIKARYDAVWHQGEDEYKEFDTADTHALVIALIPSDDAIATLQYGRRPYSENYGTYFAPSSERLEGKSFRMRVELIGKYPNEVIVNKPFDFSLGLDPQATIRLI